MLELVSRRWAGRSCVVAATGPSLNEDVADACRGRRVVAVNDAWRLMPFAEVLYAGDADWWELHQGCPTYAGERWSTHEKRVNEKLGVAERYGIRLVQGRTAEGFSTDPGVIHYGSNSGFQAINLAILFGATRIVLVGFDMQVNGKRHFFGDHPVPGMNRAKYEHFIPDFVRASRRMPDGVEILNATPESALVCFPRVPLEQALAA